MSSCPARSRLPPQLPLTEGVETAFLDRARRLPEDAQLLLLVAAADDSGRLDTVVAAAALLGAGRRGTRCRRTVGADPCRGCRADLAASAGAVGCLRRSDLDAAPGGPPRPGRGARPRPGTSTGGPGICRWPRPAPTSHSPPPWTRSPTGPADGRDMKPPAPPPNGRRSSPPEPDARAQRLFAAATSSWAAGDSGRARALADEGRGQATDADPARGPRPAPRPAGVERRVTAGRPRDHHERRPVGGRDRRHPRLRDGNARHDTGDVRRQGSERDRRRHVVPAAARRRPPRRGCTAWTR